MEPGLGFRPFFWRGRQNMNPLSLSVLLTRTFAFVVVCGWVNGGEQGFN